MRCNVTFFYDWASILVCLFTLLALSNRNSRTCRHNNVPSTCVNGVTLRARVGPTAGTVTGSFVRYMPAHKSRIPHMLC
jgi:hypothetical protein